MTASEWLKHLASLVADKLPRSRTALAAFAPSLAKDVPNRWFSAQFAQDVANDLASASDYAALLDLVRIHGNRLPQTVAAGQEDFYSRVSIWNRLLDERVASGTCTAAYLGMVWAHGPDETKAHILATCEDLVRQFYPHWLTEGTEDADKDWWRNRLRYIIAIQNPDARWLHASTTLAQVGQSDSWPRPWLVEGLHRIIAKAADEGADTRQSIPEPRAYRRNTETRP